MVRAQQGLEGRHCDKDGGISKKHGDTRVSTLRQVYGSKFASGIDGDKKLSDVWKELDKRSRVQVVRDYDKGVLPQRIFIGKRYGTLGKKYAF
jgi:hypothetical protein